MKSNKKQTSVLSLIIIDILLICLITGGFSIYHFLIPRKLVDTSTDISPSTTKESYDTSTENSNEADKSKEATEDFTEFNFSDKFTNGEPITNDTSYKGKNINVSLSCIEKDGITYYVEDIYLRSMSNFKTAFAEDSYGISLTDWVLNMAKDNNAIAAINGDFYGIDENGVVIRNGVLYRSAPAGDVCVLFKDGTMKVYSKDEFNGDEVMAQGAWQAWDFGPSLLSASGEALTTFNSKIAAKNPRTALGYYEPGHYCFVVVDGRQANYSEGLTLKDLAALMKDLGCTLSYNLDGGRSSTMTFKDSITNSPFKDGREVSDILYIAD